MKDSKIPAVANFIGMLFVLIGLYASVRTVINLTAYDKYPTTGAIAINLFGMPFYGGPSETDCDMIPSDPYLLPLPPRAMVGLESDEVASPSSEEIKKQAESQKKSCLSSVIRSREDARMNDINTSAFFLFMGVGILGSSRIFFKRNQ